MFHRPTAAPVWTPARWLHQRREAFAGPTSNLLRYVMIAALLTAIGCAYLWQVNSLSNIYDKTIALQNQARELEKQNVVLAEQLAQWSSPAYVERRSAEQGYVVASPHVILEPAVVASSVVAADASR